MGSAFQQLSQLTDGRSLSLCVAYLLRCDATFWGLATRFCTCDFSKHLSFFHLQGFAMLLSGLCSLLFLCLKGLVCINCSLSCAAVGHCAHSLEARWLIGHSAPRSCCQVSEP
jgi:hypothetical protein